MYRTRSLLAVVTLIGLAGFVACGGGEASEQQAESGEAASSEMAKPATTDEGGAMQQGEQALPEGVTAEMIAQGKEVYAGAGLCYVCHGGDGSGMPGLGANLIDDEWVHGDGSLEGIAQTVMNGVDAGNSSTGTAMPPKGGSGISDEQVEAVAAYVFSLSSGSK